MSRCPMARKHDFQEKHLENGWYLRCCYHCGKEKGEPFRKNPPTQPQEGESE